jgi:carbamoyltransferase
MNILGIHDGHNASACLAIDGKITAALQEERLRREKNFAGFPSQSVDRMLRDAGLSTSDLDAVAISGHEMPDQNTRDSRLAMYRRVGKAPPSQHPSAADVGLAALKKTIKAGVKSVIGSTPPVEPLEARLRKVVEYGIPRERIKVVEHHLAHAAAAYHGLGDYDHEILVLTNDGEGDGICASVNIGRNGTLERVGSVPRSESVGNLYAVITFLLGMVPLEHEYKLMGMAPYADEKRAAALAAKFRGLFTFDGVAPYGWRRAGSCPDLFYSYGFMREMLEFERFDTVCGGLQRFVEQMLLEWVRNCIRATGIRRLALSGGVFMNVKLNKAIMELPEVDDIFIFPSCGDETNAIGAAMHVAAESTGAKAVAPIREFYLGPRFSSDDARQAIEEFRFSGPVEYKRIDDIEARVAELLAGGEVVARFKGREEFGARALGNRSLLADPSNPDVVKTINNMIKCRDFWMPFATSMTDKQAEHCLVNPKHIASPYMILTFDSTAMIRDYKAGAHPYDLTVRPQVVYQDWNPDYYRLIECFQEKSGKRGGVLNTSFNLHGFPLVSTPSEALDVFERSGLRHLAVENWLVSKTA